MKKGLILVDIQNDYFSGGKYELKNPEQAAVQAGKILAFFRQHDLPVYHVRHISLNAEATFFLPDTDGVNFYKDICVKEGEEVITKHKPDSFLGTNLKEKLEEKGVDQLVVCGMMTHMCIDTTVRSAAGQGYLLTLIEDACATRDLKWRETTVNAEQVQHSYMAAVNGTFAKVEKADEFLINENDIKEGMK